MREVNRETLLEKIHELELCKAWDTISINGEFNLEVYKMLLATMDAEPVAWRLLDSPESSVTVTDNDKMAAIWRKNGRAVQPLCPIHHCTDVPAGMVVSYARPQPISIDLPNLEVSTLLKIMSGEIRGNSAVATNLARHLLKAMSVQKATKQTMRTQFPSLSDYECVVAADVWNACRAAMLDRK